MIPRYYSTYDLSGNFDAITIEGIRDNIILI